MTNGLLGNYEQEVRPTPIIEDEQSTREGSGTFADFQQTDEYAELRALGHTNLAIRRGWLEDTRSLPPTAPRNALTVGGVDITEMSGTHEGPDGVRTISSGRGDPGGVSYGKHQLSTNAGTMQRFLNSDYASKYAEDFNGLTPGTPEFNEVYLTIAEEDERNFEDAQTQFILETHYKPLQEWAGNKGFDTNDPGIASALYSISVQHSGWRSFLNGIDTTQDTGQVIDDIYAARTSYVNNNPNIPDDWKAGIANRYNTEKSQARTISQGAVPDQEPDFVPYPVNFDVGADRSEPEVVKPPQMGGYKTFDTNRETIDATRVPQDIPASNGQRL